MDWQKGSDRMAARSPDLTPLDFFLWGYVKQKVYQQPIKDVDDLKQSRMKKSRIQLNQLVKKLVIMFLLN